MIEEESRIYLPALPLFKICPKVINTYGLHLHGLPMYALVFCFSVTEKPQDRVRGTQRGGLADALEAYR